MKKYITSAFISLVFITQASAQYSVKGIVLERNQQPAAFATVVLQSIKDSSLVKGGLTDEKGSFQLDNIAEGDYFLSVQYLGFLKKYSPAFGLNKSNPTMDLAPFTLAEDVQQLKEVTVTAQRNLFEQKSDRIVMNVENSVITKGQKVYDLLKYVPLVQTSADGKISVANKGSVLILVDGRQMGPAALDVFLQNFSAEDIVKVEVITNPPARYDASAGAVINILTKKSLGEGLNGRFSLTYSQGQYGRFTPDASWNYRRTKWNVFGSVSGNWSSILTNQTLERFFPDGSLGNSFTALDRYNGLASFWGIDFSPNVRHTLGVRLSGNWKNPRSNWSTLTSFRNQEYLLDSLLRTDNNGHGNNQTYDLNFNYTGKFDSTGRELQLNVTSTFFNQSAFQNIEYQKISLAGSPMGNTKIVRVINPSQQRNFIAQADYTLPTKKSRWDVGGKFIFIGNNNELRQENLLGDAFYLDSAFSNSGRYRELTYAGYTNFSHKIKNWNVQLGLRAEQTHQELTNSDVKRSYFGLYPSLSLNRSAQKGFSWGITYSRKIARPSLNNLVPFRTIVDPYSIVEGNPNLNPQFANSVDTYLSKGSITFFANYTHIHDLMTTLLYGDPKTKVYLQKEGNLSSVHTAYLGVNLSHNVTKWWQTNSNVTVSATHTSSAIAEVADLRVNGYGLVLSSTNIFSLPRSWKAEFSINYNSPNRWTIWNTGSMVWTSISVSKEISPRANLRVAVQDITRSQINRLNVSYGVVDITSRIYNDTQRIRVSFSYSFGKKTVKGARQTGLGNEAEKSRMGGK